MSRRYRYRTASTSWKSLPLLQLPELLELLRLDAQAGYGPRLEVERIDGWHLVAAIDPRP